MKYNITYFEIVQITLEAMGAAFCIICLIALLIYGKTRILNTIKKLIVLNFFAQISDACAYIFRGNSDSVSLVMTRASNFFFFLIELLMVMYFVRLTCNLLEEYGIKTDRRILVASNILFSVAFILIITNLFTGILYYFDENNYYHRNTGWYFYTILIMLIMLMVLLYVVSKRAIIDKSIIIGITIYTLVPIFSGCLQIIFYGISLLSFSITVSLMIIIYIHMRLTKNNSMQDGYSKKVTA